MLVKLLWAGAFHSFASVISLGVHRNVLMAGPRPTVLLSISIPQGYQLKVMGILSYATSRSVNTRVGGSVRVTLVKRSAVIVKITSISARAMS
jgi:hypothetical protein